MSEVRPDCEGLIGYAQKVCFYPVSNKDRFINWKQFCILVLSQLICKNNCEETEE